MATEVQPTETPTPATESGGLKAWFCKRLPIEEFWRTQVTGYFAPKNFNFWYFFGVLAMVVLAIQLFTGIFLAMFYKPAATMAFGSVAYIMREVSWGWLIRYIHSTGASAFFIVVYLHMFRALMYGSYKKPRELLWIVGMLTYLVLMAEAFFGYVLPWGNMSYWAAQVIVNLFTAIPVVGSHLAVWIRGDYGIADATLNRFFALHVIAVPLALLLLVMLHLVALRRTGSNNPDGIEIKEKVGPDGKPLDGIPFHPYYTVKDLMGVGVFLVLFAIVVFFIPTVHGLFLEHANFTPANALSTPGEITPAWYLTPYYAILRAVPNKLMGVVLLVLSVAAYLFLPWLDRSPVKSIRYKGPLSRLFLTLFVIAFLALMVLGRQPADASHVVMLERICAAIYFSYFVLMPFYTRIEATKPVPERVTYHAHT